MYSEFSAAQKNWDRLAEDDPLWVVLTAADKKGGGWDPEEFFATGVKEVGELMAHAALLNVEMARERALDFGCGVGRLTQGLCQYFDEVVGIDISRRMIDLARRYNRYGDRCRYFVNAKGDLRQFSDRSFDFVVSMITLQHIPPEHTVRYIEEFLRVLRRGGFLVFQMPGRPTKFSLRMRVLARRIMPSPLLRLYRKIRYGDVPRIEMYGIKREKMIAILEGLGARILDVRPDGRARVEWESFTYWVRKP